MERLEIGRLIVREALVPTALEDTEPLKGQGAPRRLVRFPLVAFAAGNRRGPRRHAGAIPQPMPRTLGGGPSDTANASAPRISCPGVP